MGFLNNFFGSDDAPKQHQSKINWVALTYMGQLDEIEAFSNQQTIAIFKHSTRCSISRMALKQFENEFAFDDTIATYFLDLIEYREISNEIASRYGVTHQSPQLILIKNGQAVYNASHSDIDASVLAAW
jgi:bacillithiol system protein YtxJ